VAYCETGGTFDPLAVGHLGERGLFQIHPIHASRWPDYWDNWSDPRRNAEMAYDLSAGGTDWSRWSCRP
jgi:hypothetical protein